MSLLRIDEKLKIVSVEATDMRWPTSLGGHGSDAMVIFFLSFTAHSRWKFKIYAKINYKLSSTPIRIIRVLMWQSEQIVQLWAMD